MPGVSNLRKLYASTEDTGRIVVLATSTQMELNGKKVNIPIPSLFLKRRSMKILFPRGQALKMTFHHKTTSSRARTSFKRTLTHMKTNP